MDQPNSRKTRLRSPRRASDFDEISPTSSPAAPLLDGSAGASLVAAVSLVPPPPHVQLTRSISCARAQLTATPSPRGLGGPVKIPILFRIAAARHDRPPPRRGEMDVTFATPRGREFTLEVWYFATVREVKEPVHAREGVPAASQRLFLGGRELDDDARDAAHYGVLQGSRILLLLPDDDAAPPSSPSPAAKPAADVVRVAVSAPAIGRSVALDVGAADTVARVKELLQDHTDGALPAARTALFSGKAEMEDGRALADYDPPADGVMELCVVVRQPPPADTPVGGGNGVGARNQQRIAVKVMFGARAVALEVGAMDVVRDLRKEVERLHLPVHDSSGGSGYFFVYKQNVMDEDRTLRWHEVKNGDTIEIFNGTVTGGA